MTCRLKCSRTLSFVAAGLAAALITGAASVWAQEFPTKPVRMIVPFAPGGGSDLNARRLSDQLSDRWKQPLVVHNMGGAGGNLALAATASSEPTGYTMLFASLAIIVNNPTLYSNLQVDPDRDLAPVVLIGEVPLVLLVNAELPANDVASFIALAKQRPVHFGSGGVGTSMHLAGELLNSVAGIKMVHVPFKGAGPVVAAIMGNEIQMIMQNAALAEGQVKGGRLKALAIASPKRLAMLPNVPTFEESGVPNYRAAISYGIYVRAGTPASVIATLNRSINAVLADPAYRKQMASLGMELAGGTPQQLAAYVAAERKKWVPIIRALGIKVN
ncbi:MAG: tripartite tricarboxylate transporter substrate binding protein [Betaproteobacteria bacterium]|nr:tripartite tricarboxylate transporter substrate binding protein [Betaproteobacteria bacterium]